MEKNLSMGPEPGETQPEYKKIQDYIYKFSDQIGMGNFSKVFKGHHQHTNKQVAIKIIQLNSLTNTRLQQLLNTETKILKILAHPNVIGCEQILSSVRNCYIITELCNGGDLEKKLRKAGQFKQKQLYPIVVDIYEGLKYLAKKHIIHRDIKVSNIFISNGVHKLADFGFAQISQNQFRDISVGSPIYMSPQGYINNLYGPKTDVWAFGVLLFQLVEGRTPCHDCRSQVELKQGLLRQIDYSNFASPISSQLKNLIIQCLDINASSRINALDIQNTQWMKKAYKIVGETAKKQQKQNSPHFEKLQTTQRNYKKSFDFQAHNKENNQQFPASNKNPSFLNTKDSKDVCFKNYMQKFNNFISTEQKDHPSQHRRKHSTLDKAQNKLTLDEDSIETKPNNQSTKIFYSPKNAFSKFDREIAIRNVSPNGKFQSFHFKNNLKSPQNGVKYKDKNMTAGNHYQHGKQESNLGKAKNWIQKPPSRQGKDLNFSERIEKANNNKQKNANFNVIHYETKQIKEQLKQHKKPERGTLSGDFRNMINTHFINGNNTPINQNFQKHTPKGSEDNKGRFSQFIQARALKSLNINKPLAKEEQREKIQIKDLKIGASNNNLQKIINRGMKFGDCIGLIHYCRLCYKFACLLDEYGESEQTKKFLTNWSVQLLIELNTKIDQGQILFNNQIMMMNNPSVTPNSQNEKKKKLRDVTEEYLNKYNNVVKASDRISISLKQASSFIYNLYLVKGHEFKQKVKQKKSHLYFALICYVSILDRETRNLMEFVYEIKNGLQGKQVQKLLGIKISDFSRKNIQEIVSENVESTPRQF